MTHRTTWLKEKRRGSEWLLDGGAATYDRDWGAIDATHERFIQRLLSVCPAEGIILDAACGTGKYWQMILDSGRRVVGADRSAGMLDRAHTKFPSVPTEKVSLESLNYYDAFEGVICTDAMESVPPEDWPTVLINIRRSLRSGGHFYFTVETEDQAALKDAFNDGKSRGLPLVYGEWAPEGRYHYYPEIEQVRTWLSAAGFLMVEEAQAPPGEDPYHHFLARAT